MDDATWRSPAHHREGRLSARTLGVLVSIARSVAVFVAIVVGAAAIGALVGGMIWGQWVVGAAMAGFFGAWLALPSGSLVTTGNVYHGIGGGGDSISDSSVGDGSGGGAFGGGGF
jgi:hypothetical protein